MSAVFRTAAHRRQPSPGHPLETDLRDRDEIPRVGGVGRWKAGDDPDPHRTGGGVDRDRLQGAVIGEVLADTGPVVEGPGHPADPAVLPESVLSGCAVDLVVAGYQSHRGQRVPGGQAKNQFLSDAITAGGPPSGRLVTVH